MRISDCSSDVCSSDLFSILLPIYQTPERWLRRWIESVLAQVYPNWQLCIVDDASPNVRAMEIVDEYARGDRRIVLMRRDVNGDRKRVVEGKSVSVSVNIGVRCDIKKIKHKNNI